MDKRTLNQIYWLNKELKMWERKLSNLKQQADAVGSPSDMEPTGIHGTKPTNRTEEIAIAIAEAEEIINGRKLEIQWAIADTYKFIDTIEDSLMRQIITYRCCDLMSWRDVSLAIGGNNSEDSVRMMYKRFCDKL